MGTWGRRVIFFRKLTATTVELTLRHHSHGYQRKREAT